ncbi:uncharacterized protein LOC135471354 [Liolophura sinensis]|uniref:uncharacterized protein LOC135471354 n=1 Tax=Liolophura sinensis TaxID=3198878 RepID=UPI003158FFB9
MFETTEDGQAFPIEGKPVTGKDVVLGVSILSATGVGNFTKVTLMDIKGNTISEVPLTYITENFLTASVTVPNQPFQILLTGMDNAGNTIHRLIEDYYEPQDFRLEINQPTPIRADPNVPIEIPYTLHNYGSSDENFTVTITDASGLIDTTFVVTASAAGNGSGVFILDLQGLNLTENFDLGSLSVVITSTGSGTVSTNYNSFGVYLTNETAISAADIAVEYILPTTSPVTTPKTQESTSDGATDDTVLIVCVVSGAAALAGVASFITLRQWHKGCGKVGPYSYPKAKPTVPKPNLRRKFSFS